ncbi:MAG: hypothetical protein IIZ86_03230 [Firmicutes bacterium]|nr:hypothetical protein [Bacillota bacterium]
MMNKKEAKTKKDRSIRPALTGVICFALIAIIAISIPLYRHRQYVKFTSELSSLTTRAGGKGAVTCEMDGGTSNVSPDAAYEIYAKLIFSELKKHVKPDPALAESGLRLSYGLLDGELTLAPAEYQGEEALYVEFHSRDMDYTYLAPHLRYKDFEMLVR